MELEALYSKSFAGLENYSLKFQPGANLFYGVNERGKSSVVAFIFTMFYGFPSTEEGKSRRKRYTPRSGKPIEGNLWFSHKGRQYELFRFFGDTEAEDTCYLLDLMDNREIFVTEEKEVGEFLLGIPDYIFSQSFLTQAGVLEKEEYGGETASLNREANGQADMKETAKEEIRPTFSAEELLLQQARLMKYEESTHLTFLEDVRNRANQLMEGQETNSTEILNLQARIIRNLVYAAILCMVVSLAALALFFLTVGTEKILSLILALAMAGLGIYLFFSKDGYAQRLVAPLLRERTSQADVLKDALEELSDAAERQREALKSLSFEVPGAVADSDTAQEAILIRDNLESYYRFLEQEAEVSFVTETETETDGNKDSPEPDFGAQEEEILQSAGQILCVLSRGRYKQIERDQYGNLVLFDETFSSAYPVREFSSGTADQVYLSIRLARAEKLDAARELPLLLDDVLLNFDDKRALEALGWLAERDDIKPRQVLLFTCHKRFEKLAAQTSGWTSVRVP